MNERMSAGTIGWIDLTVEDAAATRSFYENVVGWSGSGLDMGGYEDFSMVPPDADAPVAGICHARGVNAGLPPCWMIYIVVEDLEASLGAVREGGGTVVGEPRTVGSARYCIIRDPAGAHAALYQQ